MPLEIKILQPDDEAIFANIAPNVFDNPIDPKAVSEFLSDPRHHIAVVVDDGLLVAFASAVHYIHPDKPLELWINEVAVARPYQGRGLGKALLQKLFETARVLGCAQAWVLTDRDNAKAMRLYSSLGGKDSDHVMFNFDLKP
jgi:ribosomal protein S18 acetylase RimI-like enzyme